MLLSAVIESNTLSSLRAATVVAPFYTIGLVAVCKSLASAMLSWTVESVSALVAVIFCSSVSRVGSSIRPVFNLGSDT